MSTALIVTSYIGNSFSRILTCLSYDTVICADGGYKIACDAGIKADILIGDYDSMPLPDNRDCIVLPVEKDMSDTEAAIDLAVEKGFNNIMVLGGIGGRFDHTMGNIGLLSKYCNTRIKVCFLDDQNIVFMSGPDTIRIPQNNYKYLGILSHSDCTTGLTLKSVKYPLENYTLENNTSLGVSNEITGPYAEVSFTSGKLLMILSNDSQDLK